MEIIKEVNPLTKEMCSRIIQTLLDDFNNSQNVLDEGMQEVRV